MDPEATSSLGNTTDGQSRVDVHWRTALVGVFALAMLVRLICGLEIRHSPIPELWRGPGTDMSFFVAWAEIVADGDWLTDRALHPYFSWQRPIGSAAEWNAWYGGKAFHQSPLYPYLLAVLFKLFGTNLWAVYVFQAIASGLTAVLLAAIGRRLFSPVVGLLAGVIAAVYGPLVFYDFVALRTSLTVLASAGAVWLLIRAEAGRRWRQWIVAGLVIGLAFLLRPNAAAMLVLALLAVVVVCWRRWRDVGVAWTGLLVGFGLCVAPLVARNVYVGVPPLATSGVGASTFYLANAAGAPGTGWGMTRGFPDVMRRTEGRTAPLLRELRASHSSASEPLDLLANKLTAMVHYFERTNNANPYYAQQSSVVLRWLTVPFWLILALALAGLVVTWADRRRLIWLYVALLVPFVTVMLFYQTARLRLPMIVGLIPLAAAAMAWVIARRGNVVPVVAITALLCVMVRWPSDRDPPYVQERDYAAGAYAFSRVGRHDDAIAEAREAVRRFPKGVASRVTLIEALRRAGRFDEAADVCDQAIKDMPDEVALQVRRAAIYLDRDQPNLAVDAYYSAFRRERRYVPAIAGLSRALTMPGPSQDLSKAVRMAETAVRLSPNDPKNYEVLVRALSASGMKRRAARALAGGLERTAETDPHRDELESLRTELQLP